MPRETCFVALAAFPGDLQRVGVEYEVLHDWLMQHIHGPLGFVRGTTLARFDQEARGWYVVGDKPNAPPVRPPRGPGGQFLKRSTTDAR